MARALPADLLIVNPPRSGLDPEVVRTVAAAGVPRLIYVSCDPATLARDVAGLTPRYHVERLRCFDLFPQTAHVETVLVMGAAEGGCVIYHVTVGGRTLEVSVGGDGIRVDGRPVEASVRRGEGSPLLVLHLDRATVPLLAARTAKGRWSLRLRGVRLEAEVIDERTKAIRDMTGVGAGVAGPQPVVAPMPGMVLRVEVAEGDPVSQGQGMIIVEAMKMENELRATGDGIVSSVLVQEGEAVEKDQILIELVAPEEDA